MSDRKEDFEQFLQEDRLLLIEGKEDLEQLLQKDRLLLKKICSNLMGVEFIEGSNCDTEKYIITGARDKNTGREIHGYYDSQNKILEYFFEDEKKDFDERISVYVKNDIDFDEYKYNVDIAFRQLDDGLPVANRIFYSSKSYPRNKKIRSRLDRPYSTYTWLLFRQPNSKKIPLCLRYNDNAREFLGHQVLGHPHLTFPLIKNAEPLGKLKVGFDSIKSPTEDNLGIYIDFNPESTATVEVGFVSTKISLPSKEIVVDNQNIETVISTLANWMSSQETYKNTDVIRDNAEIICEFIHNKLSTSMEIFSKHCDLWKKHYERLIGNLEGKIPNPLAWAIVYKGLPRTIIPRFPNAYGTEATIEEYKQKVNQIDQAPKQKKLGNR